MGETLAAFGVQWEILLVQIVNFSLLLLLLWYVLYRPLLRVLEERQEKIKQGLADAEEAKRRKEEIESAKETILAEARKEGQEIVTTAKTRAQEEEAAIIKDAEHRAEVLVAEAKERAEQERKEILQQSKEEIARAAILAAERILKNKAS